MQYHGLTLDSFQEQAVDATTKGKSVIVAAPTGCGKTLIADYAVDIALERGKRVIYTAPIKALSNQKFRDFRSTLGEETVGIHTGDVSMNPEAPVLIMTTEIFRNLILEQSSRLDNVAFVVFDEIHYLDDEERGTVWEESIILAPRTIQFICLSATVPNVAELAQWMATVRGTNFVVVEEHRRPVPLKPFLHSSQYGIVKLKNLPKYYKRSAGARKKYLRNKGNPRRLISKVMEQEQYPVLYFCFNRRACERNAEIYSRNSLLTADEQVRMHDLITELAGQFNLDDYARLEQMRELWEKGIAFHHAGILPAAKEIVERLFSTGLIRLLFCTETFALGINMPASTVIIDELEKFDGVDFKYLMTRQYNQIAGRAGRRGMDEVGYVYSRIIPEATDPKQVERILYGKNEAIRSRFTASYSTILNLYSRFGEEAFTLFKKSLRNYKSGLFVLDRSYEKQETQIRNRIAFLQDAGFLKGTILTEKGLLAAAVNGYEIQAAELYYSHSLEACTVEQLPVLFSSLILEEPRRNRGGNGTGSEIAVRLRFEAEKVIEKLRRREQKFGIANPIRPMCMAYAAPVHAWANGCSLSDLLDFGVPEGDLIRALRMTVQLLRTLGERIPDPESADRMHQALVLINRDAVDAQAELERG